MRVSRCARRRLSFASVLFDERAYNEEEFESQSNVLSDVKDSWSWTNSRGCYSFHQSVAKVRARYERFGPSAQFDPSVDYHKKTCQEERLHWRCLTVGYHMWSREQSIALIANDACKETVCGDLLKLRRWCETLFIRFCIDCIYCLKNIDISLHFSVYFSWTSQTYFFLAFFHIANRCRQRSLHDPVAKSRRVWLETTSRLFRNC